MKKYKLYRYNILLLIFTALLIIYYIKTIGIIVEFTNQSNVNIKSVFIEYTGGTIQIDDLKKGQRKVIKIKPIGESGIKLNIHLVNGMKINHLLDIYLEPSYSGKIEIILNKDLSPQFKEKNIEILKSLILNK